MIDESRNRIGGLYSLLPTRVNPETVSNRIVCGFETALGIQLKPTGLTALEIERAHQLTRTKYSDITWNRDK
jgi:lipoate-protein ligase A